MPEDQPEFCETCGHDWDLHFMETECVNPVPCAECKCQEALIQEDEHKEGELC